MFQIQEAFRSKKCFFLQALNKSFVLTYGHRVSQSIFNAFTALCNNESYRELTVQKHFLQVQQNKFRGKKTSCSYFPSYLLTQHKVFDRTSLSNILPSNSSKK